MYSQYILLHAFLLDSFSVLTSKHKTGRIFWAQQVWREAGQMSSRSSRLFRMLHIRVPRPLQLSKRFIQAAARLIAS